MTREPQKIPGKPASPSNEAPGEDADTRIAPDPFAVVLPAMAALGTIASIAAINWVAQERTPDRSRSKRKAGNALRDLESCCMGLQEIFRRFLRYPRLFAGAGGSVSAPMKFGVHGARISPEMARAYQNLINDAASMLVLASQNAFDVMAAIEDGEIQAPESVFFGFADCQERLNQLFQSRATLKTTVEGGNFIADRLTALVRELKQHRI